MVTLRLIFHLTFLQQFNMDASVMNLVLEKTQGEVKQLKFPDLTLESEGFYGSHTVSELYNHAIMIPYGIVCRCMCAAMLKTWGENFRILQ